VINWKRGESAPTFHSLGEGASEEKKKKEKKESLKASLLKGGKRGGGGAIFILSGEEARGRRGEGRGPGSARRFLERGKENGGF